MDTIIVKGPDPITTHKVVTLSKHYYNLYPLLVMAGYPAIPPQDIFKYSNIETYEAYLSLVILIINLLGDPMKPLILEGDDEALNKFMDNCGELFTETVKLSFAYSDMKVLPTLSNALMNVATEGGKRKYTMKGGQYNDMNKEQLINRIMERGLARANGLTNAEQRKVLDGLTEAQLRKLLVSANQREAAGRSLADGTGGTACIRPMAAAAAAGAAAVTVPLVLEVDVTERLRESIQDQLQGILEELTRDSDILIDVSTNLSIISAHQEDTNALTTSGTAGVSKETKLNTRLETLNLSKRTIRLIKHILSSIEISKLGQTLASARRTARNGSQQLCNRVTAQCCYGTALTGVGVTAVGGSLGIAVKGYQLVKAMNEADRAAFYALSAFDKAKYIVTHPLSLLGQGVGVAGGWIVREIGGALYGVGNGLVTMIFPESEVGLVNGIAIGGASVVTGVVVCGLGSCAVKTCADQYTADAKFKANKEEVEELMRLISKVYMKAVMNKYRKDIRVLITLLREKLDKSTYKEFVITLKEKWAVNDGKGQGFTRFLNEQLAGVNTLLKAQDPVTFLALLEETERQELSALTRNLKKLTEDTVRDELVRFDERLKEHVKGMKRDFEEKAIFARDAIAQLGGVAVSGMAGGLGSFASNAAATLGGPLGTAADGVRRRVLGSRPVNIQSDVNAAKAEREKTRAAELAELAEREREVAHRATLAEREAVIAAREAAIAAREAALRAASERRTAPAPAALAAAHTAEEMAAAPAAPAAQAAAPNSLPSGQSRGGKRNTRRSKLNKRKTRTSRR